MEYLNKLEQKIENLINAVQLLRKENTELKSRIENFEAQSVENTKSKDEIQKKVLEMIEKIDRMKEAGNE